MAQPGESALNLSIHREPASVWNRPGWDGSREAVGAAGWLIGAAAAAAALNGLRRRSLGGAVLAGLGGAVAWWAFGKRPQVTTARLWVVRTLDRIGWGRHDRVQEESAQSFPASDAPSWTPTTGTGLRQHGQRR